MLFLSMSFHAYGQRRLCRRMYRVDRMDKTSWVDLWSLLWPEDRPEPGPPGSSQATAEEAPGYPIRLLGILKHPFPSPCLADPCIPCQEWLTVGSYRTGILDCHLHRMTLTGLSDLIYVSKQAVRGRDWRRMGWEGEKILYGCGIIGPISLGCGQLSNLVCIAACSTLEISKIWHYRENRGYIIVQHLVCIHKRK